MLLLVQLEVERTQQASRWAQRLMAQPLHTNHQHQIRKIPMSVQLKVSIEHRNNYRKSLYITLAFFTSPS